MYSKLCALVVSACFLCSCATTVSSIQNDIDIPLETNSGYLLFGVNLNTRIKSIEIDGPKDIKITQQDIDKYRNFVLVEMPAGKYNFETIRLNDVRRYELTGGYWDFEVQSGVISYVGTMEILSTAGWFARAKIELINRSTSAIKYLEENFPTILSARQLRYKGPGEDHFFEYLEQQIDLGQSND